MDSTDRGMQIDDNDEQPAKADFSIRETRDTGSNVTVEIIEPSAKQASPN
jgi:hypothetical protein